MTTTICYANGLFVPLDEAQLPVRDLAVLRGYGVFDFLRTYYGRPFKLQTHLRRLETSARYISLDMPCTVDEIEAIVLDTLSRNPHLPEANIRIVVTGGVSLDGINASGEPGLLVLVTPAYVYPAEYYQQGVKVITVKTERYVPLAKTINYIPAIIALKQAKAVGAVEALYTNRHGHILEGTTTNFFIVQNGQLITPKDDILPGITRNVVLELAKEQFDVVERPLVFGDLHTTSEAFITASNKEIMPVRQVNDFTISAPGPNTQLIMNRFRVLTQS